MSFLAHSVILKLLYAPLQGTLVGMRPNIFFKEVSASEQKYLL